MRTSIVKSLLAIPVLILLVAASARADSGVKDPVGDFLPTLHPLAPRSGDLDVVRTRVSLIGTDFIFSARLNGNIGATPGAFYAWGVDRGLGASTRTFASLGLPNIVYDAVIVLNNTGTPGAPSLTGAVTLLARMGPPVVQPLPPENITISGNTFRVLVPASACPPGAEVRLSRGSVGSTLSMTLRSGNEDHTQSALPQALWLKFLKQTKRKGKKDEKYILENNRRGRFGR